ncbi:MAG: hypothetical protein NC339_04025 [Muribaculaceae bacterium]|nr:hypothetical protein [Muribaculaceae bacterium]
MLDTVNFKLTRTEVEGVDFLNEITPYLNPDGVAFHDYNGQQVVTGKTGNLSVSISPYQVKVKDGSLCKWLLGDNYQAMGRGDVQRAVEKLSDVLHLPFDRATITRLDVGLSIPVREPTANYFNHLGVLNYAKRLQQASGLYYYRHSQAERLCFYDKNREQRDNREEIPELYRGVNVLRYEQRFMARLPSLLGVAQVTGAMLYDEGFYITLLNRWREAYQAIRKVNTITLNFQAMKTKKDLQTMGVLGLVERLGGEVEIINHINEAKKRGDLTPKQAFDLRQAIKQACNVRDGLTTPTEAITELDKKIAEAIRYYR